MPDRAPLGLDLLEDEALVPLGHDLVALATVLADSADVRHEDARLARDVGAQVPGVAGRRREHGAAGDLVHVGDPLVLRLDRSLDGTELVAVQVGDQVSDPIDVLLDGDEHVAQHGRAARPCDREQVGEAVDLQAEIRPRAVLPAGLEMCAGLRKMNDKRKMNSLIDEQQG